jgi:hypothetical protein
MAAQIHKPAPWLRYGIGGAEQWRRYEENRKSALIH